MSIIIDRTGTLYHARSEPTGSYETWPGYRTSQFQFQGWSILTSEEMEQYADAVGRLRHELAIYPPSYDLDGLHPHYGHPVDWHTSVAWSCRDDGTGVSPVTGGELPWWHSVRDEYRARILEAA